MLYEDIHAQKEVTIDCIRRIQTFRSDSDATPLIKNGEFWEFVYVTKGPITITNDTGSHLLAKNQLLFRQPDKSLEIHMNLSLATEWISISFDSSCACLHRLGNHPISISSSERRLLHHLILEAQANNLSAFASKQLQLLYLQLLLILLIRNDDSKPGAATNTTDQPYETEENLFHTIVFYMEEHIREQLTIEQICHDNLISRTLLQKLFTEYADCGIIEYFSHMKINTAKQLIRKNNMNFSQIAEYLGYNSIHYFSRQFKKLTGTTPSDYALSIRIPQ